MALTLNQIVSRLRSLALSHLQVNSFYFGDVPEFDANGEIDYAACFVEQQPGNVNRIERQQRFSFKVYFVDRVGVSQDTERNETEVLSDMSSVASDFLAMLMAHEYEADWMIEPTSQVTPVTESLGDMVAGVFIEIGILVDFLADRCQVPAEDVEFETDFEMARTRLLKYTASGTEGNSFVVTDLAGKQVIAIYRSDQYKRPLTAVPADDETIKVFGTQGNGFIEATGSIQLKTGDAPIPGEKFDFLIHS